ncbi:cytidine deaminase [Azospirillum argentinense]|uniref:Cytidine deaminase n=1 Tax=Azospirillum argentinense TaxID=2970906 RepID=A0A060DMR0_9PROT|nr:cytidine deaminase [Azospirillum argentinense]AIB12119.1 cytidine deaminase [Azospirillum argentinense]EZQ08980.1 cytidine deaminase [Azospirillum argentinense]KAA1054556.1 Cytidine deaminase [Azospirillum argentinense]MBK3802484.1 cytidine deaminase [Azospirillum argentinense]PNQ96850.1 cytidine deaminase [Azospirillum argentinense]
MSDPLDSLIADSLIAAARDAMAQAYAPYSHFSVGAAILGESGRIHAGANVENAAYPQGQCAEASAIGAMILSGDRSIRAIAVMGGQTGDGRLCTPCGGCRQRLREFAKPDTPIHVCGPEGLRQTFRLDELLPHSFGPDNLDF